MDEEPPAPTDGGPADEEPTAEPVTRSRTRRRTSRRRAIALASFVVLALLVVLGAAAWPRGAAVTTTTTAAPTSTTTSLAPWPATQAWIATAKNPSIVVHADPPAGWDTMRPAEVWQNPPPPSSQSTMPPRPALPRSDYPIQGRYTSANGWSFNNPTTWGGPFVMLVTERRGDWLKVEIPVRPNGTPGYVAAADVTMSSTDYHLDLRLGTRTLTLYQGSTAVLTTPVVVGKPETHTPTGRFYITDKIPQSNAQGSYGPIILPTNAYSEQIDEFDDGVPVIALHGTNRPELLGQAVSNGCVRVPNDQITKIASLIPLGTPIDVAV